MTKAREQLEAAIMAVTLTKGAKPHYIDVGQEVWKQLEGEDDSGLRPVGAEVCLLNDIPVFCEQALQAQAIHIYDEGHELVASERFDDNPQ